MNTINPICYPMPMGQAGMVSIDIGQEIRDFAAANPLVTISLVGLLGLGIYQLLNRH